MPKINIKSLTTCIGKVWKQNGHNILTGGAIVGVIVTTGFAIADTVKAVKKVEEKKPETKTDLVKTAAPCYIRTGVSLAFTVACNLGVKHEYTKQISNLASTLVLSETARKEYEEATKEVVGEEKEQEIRDKIAEKQLKNSPYTGQIDRRIHVEEGAEVRCYEPITRQYFLSNQALIMQSVNRLNAQMIGDMYISFEEWLDSIGLPFNSLEFFDDRDVYEDLGWNIDNLIDIGFSSQVCTDGVPALVICYKNRPETEYTHWTRYS